MVSPGDGERNGDLRRSNAGPEATEPRRGPRCDYTRRHGPKALEAALRNFLVAAPPAIIAVYRFGSRARGMATPASDVDLAVLYDEAPPPSVEEIAPSISSIAFSATGSRGGSASKSRPATNSSISAADPGPLSSGAVYLR